MAYWLDNLQNSVWKCGGMSDYVYTPYMINFAIVVPSVANDGGINSSKIKFNDIRLIHNHGDKANVEIGTEKPSGGWSLRNFRFLDTARKFRTSDIEINFTDFDTSGGESEQLYTLVFDIDYDGTRQVYECNFITTSEKFDGKVYTANSQGRIDIGDWDDLNENTCNITAYTTTAFTAVSSGVSFSYRSAQQRKTVFFKADGLADDPQWTVTDDSPLTTTTMIVYDGFISLGIGMKANEDYNQTIMLKVRCTASDGTYAYLDYPIYSEGLLGEKPSSSSPSVVRIEINDNDYVKNNKLYCDYDSKSYPIDIDFINCEFSGIVNTCTNGIGSAWATYDEYGKCITLSNNNTNLVRSGYITFKATDNSIGATLYVEQGKMSDVIKDMAYIKFRNSEYHVDYSGSTSMKIPFEFAYVGQNPLSSLSVTCSNGWIVNYITRDGSRTSSTSADTASYHVSDYSVGSGELDITISSNSTSRSREGVVTLSATSMIDNTTVVSSSFKVSQDRRPNDGLYISNSILTISSDAQTKTFPYIKEDEVIIDSVSADTEGVTCTISTVPQLISVSFTDNIASSPRDIVISVKSHLQGEVTSMYNTINVKQIGRLTDVEKPIYDDSDLVVYSDNSYIDYKFIINGETKYVARAFMFDGCARIRTNEIVKHYMDEGLDFSKGLQNVGGFIKCDIYLSEDDWANEYFLKTCYFFNDWTYDSLDGYCFNYPISNKYDKRQYFLFSFYDSVSTSDGTSVTITKNHAYTDSYKASNGIYTVVYPLYDVDTLNFSYRNSILTPYSSGATAEYTCNEYCLYYKNRRGGWDSMLFNSASKQTDKVTINSYKTDAKYDSYDFETINHQKDIDEEWALKTCYLSDRQSKILSEHLLTSNKAYLHIFETGEIKSVNISNSSVSHTTWKNNGRKMIQYTVNVSASKTKYVR